jgi:hypothetical protein
MYLQRINATKVLVIREQLRLNLLINPPMKRAKLKLKMHLEFSTGNLGEGQQKDAMHVNQKI